MTCIQYADIFQMASANAYAFTVYLSAFKETFKMSQTQGKDVRT